MRRFALALNLLLGLATAARAQSTVSAAGHGVMVGLTLDQYYSGSFRAHGISLRGIGPARASVTSVFAAGFLQNRANSPLRIAVFDLGLGHFSFSGPAAMLVEVGATGLFGGGGGAIGGYAGLTFALPVAERLGVRLGISRRAYLADAAAKLWMVSVGVTTMPNKTRSGVSGDGSATGLR